MLNAAIEFPPTRQAARDVGSKFYFTGNPCKHGSVAPRLTSACKCWCDHCRKEHSGAVGGWQKRNPVVVSARLRQWRGANPEKTLAAKRRHADKIKRGEAVRSEGCPGKRRHRNALRREAIRQATPAWADLSAIEAIYIEASVMRQRGENVHVDHIIPLTNSFVCGLHVAENLQIISATENARKHNRFGAREADEQIKGLQDILRAERK